MNTPLQKWMATALLVCISGNSVAEAIAESPQYVLSVNIGSADMSGDFGTRAGESISQTPFDVSSDNSYSVALGIENTKARAMLEYYVTETGFDSAPLTAGELKTESIFYSGYWVPEIYRGIKGILGGGIGYSRHALDNIGPDNLKESDWAFKVSAGLEYGPLPNLSIYALADLMFHEGVNDYVTQDATPPVVIQRTISSLEQTRLAFGINFRF